MKVLRWQEASLESSKGFFRSIGVALKALNTHTPKSPSSGGIRKHLAGSGSTWKHLAASGSSWFGSIWWHLGSSAASGIIWQHLGASGSIWKHLAAPGSIWAGSSIHQIIHCIFRLMNGISGSVMALSIN